MCECMHSPFYLSITPYTVLYSSIQCIQFYKTHTIHIFGTGYKKETGRSGLGQRSGSIPPPKTGGKAYCILDIGEASTKLRAPLSS